MYKHKDYIKYKNKLKKISLTFASNIWKIYEYQSHH